MLLRVLLAINRPTLLRQLRARLAGTDLVVESVRRKQPVWDRLRREICDVVVISESRIPRPAGRMLGLLSAVPEAPAVVVILDSGGGDPIEHRAQLLAAGCQAVLDSAVSAESLADVLLTVVEQQREIAQQRLASAGRFTQPLLRDFVSHSPVMQAFLGVVQRVVNSTVSLLILGETGVGKERLARAIHNEGPRTAGPFVAVNCGALPESLLESELFGHEEGAFTGASRSRRGCFEMAHGGTVFLDEIGEVPNHLQVKLLRVLQDREVRRLGGERSVTVDVRIMAATNRDPQQQVELGELRQDLYYRLNVMSLTLPPLRERREDIHELAINYVHYLRPRINCDVRDIDDEALLALERYDWPGNVRELINVIERAMLLAAEPVITVAELPAAIGAAHPAAATAPPAATGQEPIPAAWLERPWREVRRAAVRQLERAYLHGLLRRTGGRVGETARLAGMEPRSLYDKMRRHGLAKEDYRECAGPEERG